MSAGTKRQLQSKLFRTMSTAPVSQPVSHPTFTPDGGGGGERKPYHTIDLAPGKKRVFWTQEEYEEYIDAVRSMSPSRR